MKGYLVNTDYQWFRFLREHPELDEVNFWRPMGSGNRVRIVEPGDPVIFKLKQDHHHAIVGFGQFVMDRTIPVREAWDVFGDGNGVASLEDMWSRITHYVRRNRGEDPLANHSIGCVLLSAPVFFADGFWVDPATDFSKNTVSGKGYDLATGEGKRIWADCLRAAEMTALSGHATGFLDGLAAERFGRERTIKPRLGQGTFRYAVCDAYGKCAVSLEHSLPVLEASHIIPYGQGGRHELSNGLLLRADIHRLFDLGYVTVTPDYRFKVGERLAEEYHNGKSYYALDGARIWVPDDASSRPAADALEFHAAQIFVG